MMLLENQNATWIRQYTNHSFVMPLFFDRFRNQIRKSIKPQLIGGVLGFTLLSGSLSAMSQTKKENASITENTVQVGDQKVRYLKAGSGKTTVVLLHGWPQNSDEWKHVIPLISDRYTVIAPDLRGVGGTSAPSRDFKKTTMAADVHALIAQLGLKKVVLVGHDIGGMVAYTYSKLYPKELTGLVIMEVAQAGIDPWSQVITSPHVWHFEFHNQNPLAEDLVGGRQEDYFRYFIKGLAAVPSAITDEDIKGYASAYGSRESLNAGFEYYRSFEADGKFNLSNEGKQKVNVPALLIGAEHSMGQFLPPVEAGLKSAGLPNVRSLVIKGSGHWIPEEQPEVLAKELIKFIDSLR